MAQVHVTIHNTRDGGVIATVGNDDLGWDTYPIRGERQTLPVTFMVPDAHEQPLPVVRNRDGQLSCQDLVIADIEARKAVGMERYGVLLYPNNGRDTLQDAYEEALDLTVYLRGLLEEREAAK